MRLLSYLVTSVALPLCLLVSCIDVKSLELEIDRLKEKLEELEGRCDDMNASLAVLDVAVTALAGHDYVTEVKEIKDADGNIQGYVLDFIDNPSITIWLEAPETPEPEVIVVAPVVSVKLGDDGVYYWASDGEFILDVNGSRVPVGKDGHTPRLKIMDGAWHVSYDEGLTWKYLAEFDQEVSDGYIFTSVDLSDPTSVVVTLSDGQTLTLPTAYDGLVSLSLSEPDQIYSSGALITLTYNALKSVSVTVDDIDVDSSEVIATDSMNGTIKIQTRGDVSLAKQRAFILFTYDGSVQSDWRLLSFDASGKVSVSDIK